MDNLARRIAVLLLAALLALAPLACGEDVQAPEEPVVSEPEAAAEPEAADAEIPPEPETEPAPDPAAFELQPADPSEPMARLEEPQPLRHATIRAAGDLMVHIKQLRIAKKDDGTYDFYPQYALVNDALGNADYTIANLETTIGKYGNMAYSGYPLFNTPETLLDTVRDAGVDFLTLANNHMLDRYFEGMQATVDWVEKYGFAHGGANRTPEEREKPVIVEVNGIRIGVLCYTQMTNGMEAYCSSAVKEYGVCYLRKTAFDTDIEKLKAEGVDVIIAVPHWGEEYRRRPEQNTVNIARYMIAAGVDVVLGSHPHMVQPVRYETVETADGGTRTGLVAYSLGNFISNMLKQYTDSGIILQFMIQEKQEGGFAITCPAVVPIYCWKRDDAIQAVPSGKYLDSPPEGMSENRYSRMKETYRELRSLIDDSIPFIAE